MYNLSEKQFKPCVIFISLEFIPILVLLIVALILDFSISILIVFLFLLSMYIFLIVLFKKLYVKENSNLILYDNKMVINYPNINNCNNVLEINYDDIIKLEYFRLFSIVSWFQLFYSWVLPKCVYITYEENYDVRCELMGHMDLKDVKKIAIEKGIELKIK